MKKATSVGVFLIAAFALAAQKTGVVEYKELGLAFSIPQGRVGQETDEGFLMGHHTEPGFILLLPHEYSSLETLRQEAAKGIKDEGVSLQMTFQNGQVKNYNINGVQNGKTQPRRLQVFLFKRRGCL